MHLTERLLPRCIDEGGVFTVHTDQGMPIMIPTIDMQRVLQRTLSGAISCGKIADRSERRIAGGRTAHKRRWLLRRG